MSKPHSENSKMITRALNTHKPEEQRKLYNEWAPTFDDEVLGLSYVAPQMGAALMASATYDRSGVILDLACGTGLVAQELAGHGFVIIDGADVSEGMLDIARKQGLYRNLCRTDLTKSLDFTADSYAGTICIGTLGTHIDAKVLGEMVRITKSGGAICISVRSGQYQPAGYGEKIKSLYLNSSVQIVVEETHDYIQKDGASAVYCVLRVI